MDWNTTVLVVSGAIDGRGGAPMRWRALREALGNCAVHETGCDRWGRCRQGCSATSGVCDAYADQLAVRLRATGVSTVVCSGVDTHRYVGRLAAAGLHVVFDMHNVEAPLYRAIRAAIPAGSPFAPYFTAADVADVERDELAAVTAAHELWTCSERDRLDTIATYPHAAAKPVRVVPNAVAVSGGPPERVRPRRVAFTGRMDFYPNVLAGRMLVEEVAPRLPGLGCSLPVVLAGAQLWPTLFGPPPPRNVRLVNDPESTADLIAGSIMAVPLTIGGGSRMKVLEAFALGAPVVSTAKGVEGLAVTAGEHYLPAEEPRDFAASIAALSRWHRMRARVVTAAGRLVHERYSIDALRDAVRVSNAYG